MEQLTVVEVGATEGPVDEEDQQAERPQQTGLHGYAELFLGANSGILVCISKRRTSWTVLVDVAYPFLTVAGVQVRSPRRPGSLYRVAGGVATRPHEDLVAEDESPDKTSGSMVVRGVWTPALVVYGAIWTLGGVGRERRRAG